MKIIMEIINRKGRNPYLHHLIPPLLLPFYFLKLNNFELTVSIKIKGSTLFSQKLFSVIILRLKILPLKVAGKTSKSCLQIYKFKDN